MIDTFFDLAKPFAFVLAALPGEVIDLTSKKNTQHLT